MHEQKILMGDDDKPLISVITVVYQASMILEKTIKSVLAQPYPKLEYIIIDGGSTDGTIDLIEKYGDQIDSWISEPDQGIYDAMNKGLDLATGEGVIFLNAGDLFVGDVFGRHPRVPSFIHVKTTRRGNISKIRLKSRLLGLPNCHQGILFHTSKLRYNLQYQIASDYDYFLRHAYRPQDLLFLEASGYVYFHPNGVSQDKYIERDEEIAKIIEGHFSWYLALRFRVYAYIKHIIKVVALKLNRSV